MCRHVSKFNVKNNFKLRHYPYGTKVIAIDWNENFLEKALMKPILNNLDFNYKVDDVENMTLKSDLFDCVVDTFWLDYKLNP